MEEDKKKERWGTYKYNKVNKLNEKLGEDLNAGNKNRISTRDARDREGRGTEASLNSQEQNENHGIIVEDAEDVDELAVRESSREQSLQDINPDFKFSVFFEDQFMIITPESRKKHVKKHVKFLVYEVLLLLMYCLTAFLYGFDCPGSEYTFEYF